MTVTGIEGGGGSTTASLVTSGGLTGGASTAAKDGTEGFEVRGLFATGTGGVISGRGSAAAGNSAATSEA
jgi:hypothetical protein